MINISIANRSLLTILNQPNDNESNGTQTQKLIQIYIFFCKLELNPNVKPFGCLEPELAPSL